MSTNAPPTQQERTLTAIRELSRQQLVHELLNFKGALRLDFTEAFLEGMSDEKLRHILLAACIHGHPTHLPGTDPETVPDACADPP